MRTFVITIAGKDYEAQALPLGKLRDFTRNGVFEKLNPSSDPQTVIDSFEAVILIIAAALKPRYPECNEAWVADNIPAGPRGRDLLTAVMRESGLIPPEGDGGGNVAGPKSV